MSAQQERAEAAARELALAIKDLCEAEHGKQYGEGEYAVELRVYASPGETGYSWDWWWRPLDALRGGMSAGGLGSGRT